MKALLTWAFAERAERHAAVRQDLAVVLGGASCVGDDLKALSRIYGGPWDGLVVAANDIGIHLLYLDHWATLHPELFYSNRVRTGWLDRRAQAGLPNGFVTWCQWNREGARVDRRVQGQPRLTGSSGLLATKVAMEVCSGPVVLCGVPMTRTPYFEESTVHPVGKVWGSAGSHWRAWIKPQMAAVLKERVRSMSGLTRGLLGEPTKEWLRATEGEAMVDRQIIGAPVTTNAAGAEKPAERVKRLEAELERARHELRQEIREGGSSDGHE